MEEIEVKEIWKGSSQHQQIQVNMDQLINNFKFQMEQRERNVRYRDLRETIAACVGIIIFSLAVFALPFSISSIGAMIVIGSLGYVIFKLQSNRKSKYTQELFLSVNEQLERQKEFIVNQEKLLSTVFYWMILPMGIGQLLFIWGSTIIDVSTLSSFAKSFHLEKSGVRIFTSIFIVVFGGYVVWLNRKAAKVNWQPLLKQINTLIQQLKS